MGYIKNSVIDHMDETLERLKNSKTAYLMHELLRHEAEGHEENDYDGWDPNCPICEEAEARAELRRREDRDLGEEE